MEQKQSSKLPLWLAGCTALGLVVGLYMPRYDTNITVYPNRLGGGSSLLSEVMGYIDTKYVDAVDTLNNDENAVRGLLERLDPHTSYLTPAAVAQAEEELDGSFKGIGIEYIMVNDTLQVISPITGGPAESAGLWSGDQMLQIDTLNIAGVNMNEETLIKCIRGETGTQVQVTIKRGNEPKLRQFTITRAEIPILSVTACYQLDPNTAYLRLSRFNHNTHQEFVDALLPLTKDRKEPLNLVLDLRGNPGGLLDQSIKVLSDLFPADNLLVYTQGRSEAKRTYESSGRSQVNINGLVVLIDAGSASASEVVAGAIQDHDRGWIIGERSFGKGLVQEQYPLSNGGALRITVARYYTPSGRCIQKDFTDKKAYDGEHLLRQDSILIADSTKMFYTGIGRKVYGGMGIQPDLVVKKTAVHRSAPWGKVANMTSSFVAKQFEGREKSSFPANIDQFRAQYNASVLIPSFRAYVEKQKIILTQTEWSEMDNELMTELKAAAARTLYGLPAYYQIKNEQDPLILAAMKQINIPIVRK
jgi:carboxyl-terminal processing protease